MQTIFRKIAVALIFSLDGKIAQGQKDPNKGGVYCDGYWHIPGGGQEEGETLEQALDREVKEELGLDISSLPRELVDTATGSAKKKLAGGEEVVVQMTFYTYKVVLPTKAEDTAIRLASDLVNHRWTDPPKLKELKLTPPSVELFTKLGYMQ